VLNQTFLATPEGRKLARDLIRKIGIDIVWKNVKIVIKDGSAKKHYCFYFGQTLIVLWKKFEKEESEDEESNEKSQMEHVVFEELFRLAICTQRNLSDKFLAVCFYHFCTVILNSNFRLLMASLTDEVFQFHKCSFELRIIFYGELWMHQI
jgi:hypothetical protein